VRGQVVAVVACSGLVLAGAVVACFCHAAPERPAASDWPLYALLLFGPYSLASVGCALSARRFVRALALLVLATGAIMGAAVMWDTLPVLRGEPPPAVFGSGFVCGVLLLPQYWAGAFALIGALAARSVDRASVPLT